MTQRDPETALTDALTKAVVALGRAGEPEQASRIAGKAYAEVRQTAPKAAQKLSNAMHGIVRMPGMPARPSDPQADQPTQTHPIKENPDE